MTSLCREVIIWLRGIYIGLTSRPRSCPSYILSLKTLEIRNPDIATPTSVIPSPRLQSPCQLIDFRPLQDLAGVWTLS
jgi:hypothetical protein